LREALLAQMIWRGTQIDSPPLPSGVTLRQLSSPDVPEMVALAELTEPGPFRERTNELGTFYGVFDSGRLVAMAGQRMSVPGFIEVSAVCTHPDARGKGFARTLLAVVVRDIIERRRTPFLHVLADNRSAIRVYESLGFQVRRTFHLAVLKRES
jgi:predicted GNAT family acetyltransferase